jgi:predicted amidohydrolase
MNHHIKNKYRFIFILLFCTSSIVRSQSFNVSLSKSKTIRIATCQFPVSGDIVSNAFWIRQQLKTAKNNGAEIVHFSECALSGYAGSDHKSLDNFDWNELHKHTESILLLAKALKIWIIMGTTHWISQNHRPYNSLYVINPYGKIIDRYDKQFCTVSDLAHYSQGNRSVIFEIDGIKCGLLICYDIRFPEVYNSYQKLGVQLIFQSFYITYKDKSTVPSNILPTTIQARAATHNMHISLSNTSKPISWSCHLIKPDGSIANKLTEHEPGILINDITVQIIKK